VASGTTRRRDGSPVDFKQACSAWARAARPILEQTARSYRTVINYQQLAEAVQEVTGITTGVPFRHWIGGVLEALAAAERPGEPILTSLVVHGDGTIGAGYARPVEAREGKAPADLEGHAARERLQCYIHFGATLPPGGGRPYFTPTVASRRARTSPAKAKERKACPTCFVTLPLSGACSECDG